MSKNQIIVIGAGSISNDAVRTALEKHLKNGEEIIFIDSHKDAKMQGIGTTINSEDIIKALESIPRENKPRPLSEIVKEDLAKPFIFSNPREAELKPFFPSGSPINAVTTHKKKGKYRP